MEGPAAKAIQGLPIVEASYECTVELLKEGYGNKQKIISSHIEAFLKLQACSSGKASRLRMIYDHINVYVRRLEALGVTSEHYESLLILIIISRPQKFKSSDSKTSFKGCMVKKGSLECHQRGSRRDGNE